MKLKGWHRFRPQLRSQVRRGDVFARVGKRLEQTLEAVYGRGWANVHADQLQDAIDYQRRVTGQSNSAEDWLVLLLLQAPRAARAQQQMDQHSHGYHGREARLYELIDFNDAFVSSVLALPDSELGGFAERLKSELDRFCHQVGSRTFEDRQWEAITRGLSREVAVYRGAVKAGFTATMTDRRSDAMGIDMVIGDLEAGTTVNIDCKTPSAYFLRLQELVSEGRLEEKRAVLADQQGYCHVRNGGKQEVAVDVVLLRISPEVFGDVIDFNFTNPAGLAAVIRQILMEFGEKS